MQSLRVWSWKRNLQWRIFLSRKSLPKVNLPSLWESHELSPETPGIELCLQRGTGEISALQPTLGAVTSSVPGFQLFHPDACTFRIYFCEEHLWPQQVQKEKDNPFRVSHGKYYWLIVFWLSVKKPWGGHGVPSPTYWFRPSVAPASTWEWCVLTGKPGEPKIFPCRCFIAP